MDTTIIVISFIDGIGKALKQTRAIRNLELIICDLQYQSQIRIPYNHELRIKFETKLTRKIRRKAMQWCAYLAESNREKCVHHHWSLSPLIEYVITDFCEEEKLRRQN